MLLAAGLHVVVAAAIITPHSLESVAAGSAVLVLQSFFGLKRHVNPCQRLVATDSMSEMTVLTSPSMSVTTPPGSVNSSSMTETTSSPSEIMLSRISGASVGSALTKEVMSSKPSWMSSNTSVARSAARFSKAPGILPARISQMNWPACCSSFSSWSRKALGRALTNLVTAGVSELNRALNRSLFSVLVEGLW